ncbi:MAG: ribosome small subunit-dependent GTPase A [Gammaproteobacteria bacterium]|nr:MAG: ribosome small subunit-dependent GTPase A [Gammaproteobacteria bacterium]
MSSGNSGLVIAAYGRRGRLETAAGKALPFLLRGRRLRVVCGDRVQWEAQSHGHTAIVTAVEPRRNSLARTDPASGRQEILAANVDCICVVVAAEPAPDWFVADRFLVAAAAMAARPLLISNKQDLPSADDPAYAAELAAYMRAGYDLLRVSAHDVASLQPLLSALDARQAMLVGQSGVGKSSLINALVPGADQATRALSRGREGRHATTASIMHRLAGGARLIDSPGVRDFLPAIGHEVEIQSGFPEIAAHAGQCRFRDCRHLHEPGCAVREAAATGEIWPRRYESYRRLLRQQQAAGAR